MYEYKTTVVGPLRSLRGPRVREVSGDLASAYDETLAHYSSQGWRLHSVVPIDRPLVLLVFEKYVVDRPDNTSVTFIEDFTYTNGYDVRGRCLCHIPHDAETPVSTEGLPPILPEMEGDGA